MPDDKMAHTMEASVYGMSLSRLGAFGATFFIQRASQSNQLRPSAGNAMSVPEGCALGMKTFGTSTPLEGLQKQLGFEPENLVAAAKKPLSQDGP